MSCRWRKGSSLIPSRDPKKLTDSVIAFDDLTVQEGANMKLLFLVASAVFALSAQPMPAEYDQVLKTLGKSGDFKANVLKINIPRNDLKVTVAGVATPTPFGFGGWLAMTKGDHGDVMMGDLVLLQN